MQFVIGITNYIFFLYLNLIYQFNKFKFQYFNLI